MACGAREAPRTTASAEAPRTPSVADVQHAMLEVSPAVRACLAPYPGRQVVVAVELLPAGTPSTITVVPPDAPGDPESPRSEVMPDAETTACIDDALASFHVPPFTRETFLVRYPFRAP